MARADFSACIEFSQDTSRRDLTEQLSRKLKVPQRLAYVVAKETFRRLDGAEPTDTAFRGALASSLGDILDRAELSFMQAIRVEPGPLLLQRNGAPAVQPPKGGPAGAGASAGAGGGGIGGAIASGLAEGVASGVASTLVGAIGSSLSESGGFIEDGFAPALRNGKMEVSFPPGEGPNCCQLGLGARGIRARVVFEVTDNTGPWYSNDSGVVSTELKVVVGQGEDRTEMPLGTKDYTPSEETATEDGFVREEREVCVPCGAVRNGFVYFVLEITDDDGNVRKIVQPVPVGSAATNCCGG